MSWNHSLEMVLQRDIEVKCITSVPEANSNKRPSPWGTAHDQSHFPEAEDTFLMRREHQDPLIPFPSSMRITKYLLESVTLSTAVPGN